MKNRIPVITILLLAVILLFAGALLYFGYAAYRQTGVVQKNLNETMAKASETGQKLQNANSAYTQALEKAQASAVQSRTGSSSSADTENATAENQPSVFNQDSAAGTTFNGHIIGIDPGHQSSAIDMSDTEPNGPGSSVMKAKASTGTQGSYTGVPEYQLNLEVSLKLQKALEAKGYQVVMTRTDNDTAISNAQRAQLVAQQGAEIYVRIHANGDDTHTASGALTMAPSPENPYVGHLSEASTQLSQNILDAYCTATGFSNLGVQYYDDMTGINWSSVPVTILEMGFMTYESDDRQMNDPTFQDVMVSGIVDGIDAYFGL